MSTAAFADPDAAVIRKRCCHDVVGITPVPSSLILTYISGVIGATALEYVTGYVMEQLFKGPLLGLQQPALQCSRVYLPHLIHRLGLSDDLYDACDPQNRSERAVLAIPLMWNLFFVFFVTVIFIYDSIVCTKEALAFGKSLEAMKKSVQSSITFRYRLLS